MAATDPVLRCGVGERGTRRTERSRESTSRRRGGAPPTVVLRTDCRRNTLLTHADQHRGGVSNATTLALTSLRAAYPASPRSTDTTARPCRKSARGGSSGSSDRARRGSRTVPRPALSRQRCKCFLFCEKRTACSTGCPSAVSEGTNLYRRARVRRLRTSRSDDADACRSSPVLASNHESLCIVA